ncbi:PRKR-interacting protein 1 [Babesia duncani]|nr:PRKR-interacting protein 1 [Babesia duncani]
MQDEAESKEPEIILLSDGRTLKITRENTTDAQDESNKPETERIYNVWGSSAGARSDFFYIYRKHRKMELDRLEKMDKDWKEEMENKLFHTRRCSRIIKEKEKTAKRKSKRDKKKLKMKGQVEQDEESKNNLNDDNSNKENANIQQAPTPKIKNTAPIIIQSDTFDEI